MSRDRPRKAMYTAFHDLVDSRLGTGDRTIDVFNPCSCFLSSMQEEVGRSHPEPEPVARKPRDHVKMDVGNLRAVL